MAKEILVHPANDLSRRLSISVEKWDAHVAAEEDGTPNPFVLSDEDCNDGNTFEQASKSDQKAATQRQEDRQAEIDAAAEEAEE